MQTHPRLKVLCLRRNHIRRMVVKAFLVDEELSAYERQVLDAMSIEDMALDEFHEDQEIGESIQRNGFTRVTHDRFRKRGKRVIDLDAERQERRSNIVPIRENLHA